MIEKFDGIYSFLSNFYPCEVEYEGEVYPSSEHAYQASKTLNLKARKAFTLDDMTAAMSKHLGKALAVRPGWDMAKRGVMEKILEAKFQDPELRRMLLQTGTEFLVEGNTWGDTYWGKCNGKGQNVLGDLLMLLRSKLGPRYEPVEDYGQYTD